MADSILSTGGAPTLPDYAPVPPSALGPALNGTGAGGSRPKGLRSSSTRQEPR